jgi:hypothetical protein
MNILTLGILINLFIPTLKENWKNKNIKCENVPCLSELQSANSKNCILKMTNDTTIKNLDDIVLNKIYKIPEVRKKDHFVDSITNHKHGISMIIVQRPNAKEPYYVVQVGYNNKIRFEPYYTFYVYKKNLVIKFYDTIQNEIITLEEWRKRSK